MRELDRLSPDQRAVLSLVLMQDKSYAEVASLLGSSEQAVRERAHAALDALADGAGLANGGRLASGAGPPLAADPGPANGAGLASGASASVAGPAPTGIAAPSRSHPGGSRPTVPGSRLGGALLLAFIAAAIVVAAILVSGSGGKGSNPAAQSASRATGSSRSTAGKSGSSASSGPKTDKVLALAPVDSTLKAAGVAYVFSDKGKRAFYLAVQGLPTPADGSFYAVWLYNSASSAAALGRAPSPGSNGRTEGGGPLPSNAGVYHKIVVTRESDVHASHPGEIVLSGAFALH